MSLWVELPAPLNADALLSRAAERGVSFLPGRYFSIHNGHPRAFRISFGGLAPEQITRGISILGDIARQELSTRVSHAHFEPVPAVV